MASTKPVGHLGRQRHEATGLLAEQSLETLSHNPIKTSLYKADGFTSRRLYNNPHRLPQKLFGCSFVARIFTKPPHFFVTPNVTSMQDAIGGI